MRQTLWPVVVLAILVWSLAGCSSTGVSAGGQGGGRGGKKGFGGGDVPVTVATVSQKTVPVEEQVIGNVEAYSTISLKAQVAMQMPRLREIIATAVNPGEPARERKP